MSGLNDYLHRIGKEPTAACSCGSAKQTVQHVLLSCPELTELRERMWINGPERDMRKILSEPTLAAKAAEFIIDIGLLPQFRVVAASRRGDLADDIFVDPSSDIETEDSRYLDNETP